MTNLAEPRSFGDARAGRVIDLLAQALSQAPEVALAGLLQGIAGLCGGAVPLVLHQADDGSWRSETGDILVLKGDARAQLQAGLAVAYAGGLDLPLCDAGVLRGVIRCSLPEGLPPLSPPDLRALSALSGAVATLHARMEGEAAMTDARRALESTRQRLEATLRALPDLVLELNDAGIYVDIHTSEPGLLAATRELMLGRHYSEVMPPDAREVVGAGLELARREGRAHGCRYALPLAGGERWFEASIGRTTPAPQHPDGGFVVVINDITEDQLRRAELIRLSHVAQQMTNYAIVTDPQFRVTWSNPAFEKRCGYTEEELRGRDPRQVLRSNSQQSEAMLKIDEAIRDCRAERVEVCNTDRNGQIYWVDSSLTPIRDDNGGLLGFLSVETDITERRSQEENLSRLSAEAVRARDCLEAAIDVLPDAFTIFDAEDRLVVCNQPYLEYLSSFAPDARPGITYEELLRRGVEAGRYVEAAGCEEEFIRMQLTRVRSAAPAQELQTSDGRWYRIYDKPMAAALECAPISPRSRPMRKSFRMR